MRLEGLEWDVVVEVARVARGASPAAGAGAGHGRALLHGRGAAELAAASARVVAHLAAPPAAAVEDRQFAAEALQHHLGRVFLLARLVGPFARLQLALDVDL